MALRLTTARNHSLKEYQSMTRRLRMLYRVQGAGYPSHVFLRGMNNIHDPASNQTTKSLAFEVGGPYDT